MGLQGAALATDTETELRNAVNSMNHWLGSSKHGPHWRQLLDLNVLDAQSALGHRADAQALQNVSAKFSQDLDGLDHPAFRRVRKSINAHLDQLNRNNLDVNFAIEQGKSQFLRVTTGDLEQLRDDAVFRIKMMKRYYRDQLASRQRGEFFYAVRPDQTVQFLANTVFELPPVRSKVAITEEIEAIKDRIEANELKIKKLNDQRSRINEWKQELQNQNRPDGIAPPSPDDDSAPADGLPGTQVQLSIDQDVDRIERGRMVLIEENDKLEEDIVRLEQESESIAAEEAERGKRFQKWLVEYTRFVTGFASVQQDQFDTYYGQAFRALRNLRQIYVAAANPRTEQQFVGRLEELRDEYAKLMFADDRRAAANVGYLTGWLEAAGQTTDLIASVRAQNSKPNLYLELSSGLVNQFTTQEVSEYRRVNEQVLTRLIRGIALVEGIGQVQFIPDPYQVRAAIDLSGLISSDTFAKSGKLTAYAGAVAPFNVRRELFANVGGMFASDVDGCLDLQSYFKSIDSNLKIVQRIARKQYYKSKALSEKISRERTRKQIFDQFREQTDDTIADALNSFETINERQAANGNLLPALYIHTTHDRIIGVAHRSTPYDLAATSEPANFESVPADVRVKLHESMISNYVSPIFAGRQYTNESLAIEIANLLQREPAEANEDAQEFTIRFDRARPIQIELQDNLLGVTITASFRRKGSRSRNNLKIELSFRLQNNGTSISLVPASKVNIDLVNEKLKNLGTASMISVLERIVNESFEKVDDAAIKLPLNLIPVDNLGKEAKTFANKMSLTQFRTENGWLYAGWKYQPNQSSFSQIVDTPAITFPVVEIAPAEFGSLNDDLEPSEELDEDATN